MIRDATTADLEALVGIMKQFHAAAELKRWARFEHVEDHWRAWILSMIEDEGSMSLVSEDDGVVVGTAGCALYHPFAIPVITYSTCHIWVDKDHREKGHTKALLEASETWAKEHGANMMAVGSQHLPQCQPKQAQALYKSIGFKLEDKHYVKEFSKCHR